MATTRSSSYYRPPSLNTAPRQGGRRPDRARSLCEASGLPELCIKAAKPRGLAREVWFYSRLETLQGNAIPRCFGFFTVPIADCIPGTGRWPMVTIGCPGSDVYNYCFDPDDGGYKASSPWDKWKYAPDQPLVAVLAVEKLGEPYYQNCPGDDPPHEREDLRNVVHDLGQARFVHASTMSFVRSTKAFFVPAINAIIDGDSSILTARVVACSPLKLKKIASLLNHGLRRSKRHIFGIVGLF